MPRTPAVLTAVVALAVGAAGCGSAGGDPSSAGAARTVEVAMVDIAFEPDGLEVEAGETVRFVFTNRGAVAHDAFIGDREAQAAHGAEMAEGTATDDAGGAHGEHGAHGAEGEEAVVVAPGETATLTHTFEEAGTVEIGCHQPGHYESGMKITVDVT